MTTPRQAWNPNPDPEVTKRGALKQAAYSANKAAAAIRARDATIRFAAQHGAFLWEIAEVTGLAI
jgi:hypothetical protein